MGIHVSVFEDHVLSSNLYDMPTGELGMDESGNIFLRTKFTATCLNKIGATYSSISESAKNHKVRLLPPGSRLEIIVDNAITQ